jgi:integrase
MQSPSSNVEKITLSRVWGEYQRARHLKPATIKNYNQRLSHYLGDWLHLPIVEITKDMVEERHSSIAGKAIANSTFRTLKALLHYAEVKYVGADGQPVITNNPVKRLSEVKAWHRDRRRKTVLQLHQLPLWFKAVFSLENTVTRDVLLLLIFTGMRRNEAIELKWEDVDLKAGVIKLRNTKNGDDFDIPLSDYVWRLLSSRWLTSSSEYVFPGNVHGHTVAAYTSCSIVRRRSGIAFCLHDLRRTFMTIGDEIEVKNEVIKSLVNHKIDDVTEGYIIRSIERRRRATQKITNAILRYAGLKTLEEVQGVRQQAAPSAAVIAPQIAANPIPAPSVERLNGRQKLTDQQVQEIREMSANGVRGTFIAAKYGISQDYLTDLLKHRYRKDVVAPTVEIRPNNVFESEILKVCRAQQIQPFTATHIFNQQRIGCSLAQVQEALKNLSEEGCLNRVGVHLYRVVSYRK